MAGVREGCREIIGRHIATFRLFLAIFMVLSFIILIPLIIGGFFEIPQPAIIALITSTLIFQAIAVAVAVGLGTDPVVAIAISTSVAIGVMITILQVCELFSESSSRFATRSSHPAMRDEKYSFLQHYGVIMLIPIIWIPGIALYGSPIIAWIFQWDEIPAISCMVAGWLIASSLVAAGAMGLISILL